MQIEDDTWEIENPKTTIDKMIRKALRGKPIPSDYTPLEWFQYVEYEVDRELQRRCDRKFDDGNYLSRLGENSWTLGYAKLIIRGRISELYKEECGRPNRMLLWSDVVAPLDEDLTLQESATSFPEVSDHERSTVRLSQMEELIAKSDHMYVKVWQSLYEYGNEMAWDSSMQNDKHAAGPTQAEIAHLLELSRATLQRALYALRENSTEE